MALVPIRIDRTSKPPIGTPLRSDGHWSVQGLVGAWAFNEGAGRTVFNAVTGEPLTILIGSTWRPAGLYRNGEAYTGEVAAYGGIAPITGEHGVTLTWLGVSGAAGARGLFNLGSASTVATCGIMGSDTGEGLRFLCRDLSGHLYNVQNSLIDIVDGKQHTLSATGKLGVTDMRISVDGCHCFDSTKPEAYTPYGFNVVVFGGLHRGSPELAASATHILGLIHAVEHSPSQLSSLAANPWQIYEPETVWVEVGGGEQSLFAGTIYGQSSASANLSTAVVLAAAAQGSSTAQAVLSTALEMAAQVNGVGSATGALGADISGLAGSLHGSSEAQATLATAIRLIGLAAGQCGVVGRLAEPVEILAQLRVMASDPLALRISVRDPLALRVTVH